MPAVKKKTADHLRNGGIVALVVSALTAMGVLGPKFLTAVDIQSASAATEIHEELRREISESHEKLSERIREQHVETTQRLDRIFDAISRSR